MSVMSEALVYQPAGPEPEYSRPKTVVFINSDAFSNVDCSPTLNFTLSFSDRTHVRIPYF